MTNFRSVSGILCGVRVLRRAAIGGTTALLILFSSHDLAAQSNGSGSLIRGPESTGPLPRTCDGFPVGYKTAPEPIPGTCSDYVKECVLNGETTSWNTATVSPAYSRSCNAPAGASSCQAYKCVANAQTCAPFGPPAVCTPSADGCTIYTCDPQNPGTCKAGHTKDPNACQITWEDKTTDCGGNPIYRTVTSISDACCTHQVGFSEATNRSSPPCAVTSPPPDSCGRSPLTKTLAPDPNYGDPDCCAGVELAGKFKAYDGLNFTAQENFGSLKYNDGYVEWMCQRNSSAVTVANPTTMYNLAFLGWSDNAKKYLTRLFTYAFDKDATSFLEKVDKREKSQQALDDFKTDITNGNVANSCFVCGQTRTEGGCFPPGVLVAMGDGSYSKRVEDITAGDLLWNPLLKKGFTVLTISEGREHKDLVVVQAGGQTLRMTTEHPVLTKSGMKQAIALVLGDIVLDASGHESSIEAITREPATSGLSVLNFILERSGSAHDGLLLADGLVVGDLTIQRRLAAHGDK